MNWNIVWKLLVVVLDQPHSLIESDSDGITGGSMCNLTSWASQVPKTSKQREKRSETVKEFDLLIDWNVV